MSESAFTITINGQPREITGLSPTMTLLEYLRTHGLTGSKQGCAEGDCGACTVALVERDAEGGTTWRAINSCIALLPMFAGREIVTVEGLARGEALHPVQEHMVRQYGSQCGYCTPGFVMSLFEAYYRRDCSSPRDLSDQLSGNLCRCTGYRPIRDAALGVLAERGSHPLKDDPFAARLRSPREPLPALDYAAAGGRFVRPTSLADLFEALEDRPEGAPGRGGHRDRGGHHEEVRLVPVPRLHRGRARAHTDHARPGRVADRRRARRSPTSRMRWPPTTRRWQRCCACSPGAASAAGRRMGGNLATASPIGDSAPVLLTLDASLVLASARGERTLDLAEFFLGYRKTALQPREIIKEIVIPFLPAEKGITRRADFLKVSKRRELDISIVAGAFCADLDAQGLVRRARLCLRRRGADAAAGPRGGSGAGRPVPRGRGRGGCRDPPRASSSRSVTRAAAPLTAAVSS